MHEAHTEMAGFNVSEEDKQLIESLLTKIGNARHENERMAVIDYSDLPAILGAREIHLIDRVFAINPKVYGFKGPKLGFEATPDNLVRVGAQPYIYQGEEHHTGIQFIPKEPYDAFCVMGAAMKERIGRTLLIESSYRSPAFQAITFLSILKLYKFDVLKTAQRVAIPGYSEHGTPDQLAFDVLNVDGLPSGETPQDFEGTQEFNWLIENASLFHFYMSYPKDNPYGLMFEPWHWRYKPKDA